MRTKECTPQVSHLPMHLCWWQENHWCHGLGLPLLITPPHSPMSTIFLRHHLHPEHLAKMLVLGDCQHFGQNISCHIVGSYELEVDVAICDAFPNKVVPDINMLCHSVIDGIPGKE